MNRRTAVIVLGAAVAAGLVLIAAGVAAGEHTDPRLVREGPLHAAAAYALAGYWAESRGRIRPGSWWRRPRAALADVRLAVADRPARNLYNRPTYSVDLPDMLDCREDATVACSVGYACETHRADLVAALAAEEIHLIMHASAPGHLCGEHLRPVEPIVVQEVSADVAPAA